MAEVEEAQDSDFSTRFINSCYYAKYFVKAFDQSVAKKRDMDFIFDLCDRVKCLLDDDEVNEDTVRKMGDTTNV